MSQHDDSSPIAKYFHCPNRQANYSILLWTSRQFRGCLPSNPGFPSRISGHEATDNFLSRRCVGEAGFRESLFKADYKKFKGNCRFDCWLSGFEGLMVQVLYRFMQGLKVEDLTSRESKRLRTKRNLEVCWMLLESAKYWSCGLERELSNRTFLKRWTSTSLSCKVGGKCWLFMWIIDVKSIWFWLGHIFIWPHNILTQVQLGQPYRKKQYGDEWKMIEIE